MCFVAQALKNDFVLLNDAAEFWVAATVNETVLFTIEALGNADERDGEMKFMEHILSNVHLSPSAIDQNQVG